MSRLATVGKSGQRTPIFQKQSSDTFQQWKERKPAGALFGTSLFFGLQLENCVSNGKPQNNPHSLVRKNEEQEMSCMIDWSKGIVVLAG